MATGPNFAPPLPLMQPPACRLLDPPNSPPIDPFLADRLRNHRHLAIAPSEGTFMMSSLTTLNSVRMRMCRMRIYQTLRNLRHTTHLRDLPDKVRVTRPHHALEGKVLEVFA